MKTGKRAISEAENTAATAQSGTNVGSPSIMKVKTKKYEICYRRGILVKLVMHQYWRPIFLFSCF